MTDEIFMSVRTFRPSGEPVATPVWFAPDGDGFVLGTHRDSGKVQRIRHNSAVAFTPSNYRGLERGKYADGVATVLEGAAAERAEAALAHKYGWQWTLFGPLLDCYIRIQRA